jgi:hypothetical protein
MRDYSENGRTNHCLRIICARGPKAELSKVVFGLLAEGVESGFRGLESLLACALWRLSDVKRTMVKY